MKYILVVAVTTVIFGGATYYATNRAAVSDKAALEAKVTELESQIEGLKSKSTDSIFKFSELGIQLTIPESIKDLTYATTSGNIKSGQSYTGADVTTSAIIKLDKSCYSGLGALSKVSGQYPSSPTPDNSIGPLLKQFPTFYIAYQHPQSLCSNDDSVNAKTSASLTAFRDALSTITLIE